MLYWDTEPTPQLLDTALEATQRALEIDDRNAVIYALKGRAQIEIERVLRERRQFSLVSARRKLFFLKDADQLETYLDGLKRAGVPGPGSAGNRDYGAAGPGYCLPGP